MDSVSGQALDADQREARACPPSDGGGLRLRQRGLVDVFVVIDLRQTPVLEVVHGVETFDHAVVVDHGILAVLYRLYCHNEK